MAKRGQGLPVNTIIILALALLVLLILSFVFTRGTTRYTNTTAACQGRCVEDRADCDGRITSDRCTKSAGGQERSCCLSSETILGS
jgi:hypothetical protein